MDLRVPGGGVPGGGRGPPARPGLLPSPVHHHPPAARHLDLDSELRALEESQEATQKNITMILSQAEEQLKTENISLEQYNNILQQVSGARFSAERWVSGIDAGRCWGERPVGVIPG